MRKLKYVMVAIVALTITACEKNQYNLYDDVARIQFGPNPSMLYKTDQNLADTLKRYTFYYEDALTTQDTVYFDIYAIGGTKPTDRTFTLQQEQLANTQNAVAGTHYVAFNDAKVAKFYVIKAGAVHAKVPVILLSDASLKTNTVKLKFNVIADVNFQQGELSNLWRKVEFTDGISQPTAWDASFSQFFFGKYSITKHAFLIKETGEKWDEEFVVKIKSDGGLSYYQVLAKTALINYNNAHPGAPLKDENNELIVFP